MNIDTLLYESGILLLIAAMIYMGVALFKLTGIVKEKKSIWVMPVFGAAILLVSLLSHIYANFVMLPGLEQNISLLSSDEVLFNAGKLQSVKAVIGGLKTQLLQLKAFSFTCFFLAALLLSISTGIYIKWISK